MEKSKKFLKNIIVFILLIGITFYIVLKGQDVNNIYNLLKTVKIQYIIIAIICMIIYFTLEAVNMGRTLKALNEKSNIFKNIKYVLIGFFFSAITPAASGGQPMQIYYMHKDKISPANSSLSLLINLCSLETITIIYALISLGYNLKYMTKGTLYLFIFGMAITAIALVIFLVGIFSKRISSALIKLAVKILKFFKIKNVDDLQEKLENQLDIYQTSAKYIKEHKSIMVKTVLTTFVQMTIYFSIPYWIYCSFDLHTYNILQIISLQAVLFATVSGIPLPGSVGVTEGAFLSLFTNVFGKEIVGSAMLLNRGVSFYLFVIITAILVTGVTMKNKKEDKFEKSQENV